MPSKKPQFVIRADKEILLKIAYIAKENERTSTQEIVYLMKKRIKEYEKQHGEINIDLNKPTKQEAPEAQMELLRSKSKNSLEKLIEGGKNGFNFGNADI